MRSQLADLDFLINVFGGDTTRKAVEEKFIKKSYSFRCMQKK